MKKADPKNLRAVMARLTTYVCEDKDTARQFCEWLNEKLDELADEDFFGTEAQCDPRGDRR